MPFLLAQSAYFGVKFSSSTGADLSVLEGVYGRVTKLLLLVLALSVLLSHWLHAHLLRGPTSRRTEGQQGK